MNKDPYGKTDREAYRIAYLISGYIRNTLTKKEDKELDNWVTASDHNMQLFEELTDEDNLEANLAWMDKVQSEQSYLQLRKSGAFNENAKRFTLSRVWIAAASAILVAGAFLIYRYTGKKVSPADEMTVFSTTEFQPGGNRATLTLGDGALIDLTNAKNGLLKKVNGSDISKPADGELLYEADGSGYGSSVIHTLSTPVGGQFRIKLPDGSRVWLNASTTLRYPTRFSVNERRVHVDGEAYFEVAENSNQPFYVMLEDSASVRVLGTHFNVMAYANEPSKEITLLEGSISVSKKDKMETLVPGMQARIDYNGISRRTGVDTGEITGWKDGLFVFRDASIQSIMQQVERWYDAKVVYRTEIKQQFNATIQRSEPLSKLLHLLELNGYVHFKIENKTIYVLP